MANSSPPHNSPPKFRIGGLRGFLPLSDDVVSTRGQKLPALIQSRSSASLHDLRAQLPHRRRSFTKALVDNNDQSDEESSVNGAGERPSAGGLADGGHRRLSPGVEVLMTPQMRSMRLIGNSNPRYQWWV